MSIAFPLLEQEGISTPYPTALHPLYALSLLTSHALQTVPVLRMLQCARLGGYGLFGGIQTFRIDEHALGSLLTSTPKDACSQARLQAHLQTHAWAVLFPPTPEF